MMGLRNRIAPSRAVPSEDVTVKKLYAIAFATLAAVPLAGCYSPEERALGGALLGGATGAAIGAATTGRASGAAVGGALGAASGAIIGATTAPQPYPPARRVYVEPAPTCWFERQALYDRWGSVVGYRRVRVCQ